MKFRLPWKYVATTVLSALLALQMASCANLGLGDQSDAPGGRLAQPILYAHYYGWYNQSQWQQARTNDPSLGLYDSGDDTAVTRHIEWAERAGIMAFSVSWHGEGSVTDTHSKNHLMPHIQARDVSEGKLHFMVLFETPDILGVPHGSLIDFNDEYSPGVSRGDRFLQEMNYLADTYFGAQGYHRIDGRPVVFIYLLRDVINHQSYFKTLRANMAARGFDPYFIGDVMHWQDPVIGMTVPGSQPLDWSFLGTYFEAISGYNLYDPTRDPSSYLANVRAHWNKYKKVSDEFGLRFVPFILPGYDDRKLRGLNRSVLARDSGSFYEQQWAMARDFIDSTVPHVALTSFNEWHEGTEIEPSLQHGLSYINLTSRFAAGEERVGTPP